MLRRYENEEMDKLTLGLTVSNQGLEDVSDVTVSVYDDSNLDSTPQSEELLKNLRIDHLPAGDSQLLQVTFTLTAGLHRLLWQLPNDDVVSNNSAVVECSFGPVTHEVIVTEYLANPADESACEWVELQNISNRPINLTGWQFGDAVRLHEIEDMVTLSAGEYLIVAEDIGCLDYLPSHACSPLLLSGWSSLNNDGDLVILRDQYGVVVDSFTYTLTAAGNRSIELNQDAFAAGERIWYPSTAELGATPCSRNSVTGAEDAPITVLIPKPVFCPAAGEKLEIEITCPPATKLALEIYDLVGRRQFTLAEQRLFSSTSLYYSGDSELSGRLRAGAYILLVTGGDDSDFTEKLGFAVAPLR